MRSTTISASDTTDSPSENIWGNEKTNLRDHTKDLFASLESQTSTGGSSLEVDSSIRTTASVPSLKSLQEIIREELDRWRAPEIRPIQNLRHPSYLLRQPILVVVKHAPYNVIATYDDIDLSARGNDVNEALTALCKEIVQRYDELKKDRNHLKESGAQQYSFLKHIIIETQPSSVWKPVQRFYRNHLRKFESVKEGFIKVKSEYTQIIIRISEFSVDLIEQLAEIELDITEQWPEILFDVEYVSHELSPPDGFTRFYSGE